MFAHGFKATAISLLLLASAPVAAAQSTYGIAATVNVDVITTYDLQQRLLFNIMAAGTKPDEGPDDLW